ncbi:MAG: YccF domain-containing protein [Pseudomonadota bacterium]
MTLVLNILWFIFGGGFLSWLLWVLFGGVLFVTVIGIPFGYAAFRLAGICFAPLGKKPALK